MNDDRELKTTVGFVITAVALCVLAVVFGWATQPPSPAEFSDIGEQFYADFTDPSEATRLRLASWNDELARTDVFEVKFTPESGWTIPSHNDYPADGEDQLSKTAASVVGITRGGLMPGRKDDHARYGVVDPLDQSATGTEGRGSRLTLWKGDNVVADYIIGDRVEDNAEDASGEALYYIRKAGEDGEERIYRAELDIDVSTDFADWIEPDLLQIGSVADIRRIVIDRYQVDEQSGRVSQGDRSIVTRSSATDPWTLEGLDESTESLVTGTVSKITTSLDDLEIIGVRKKPALLTAQLKQQELDGFSQLDVMAMRADLQSKGFFIDQTGALVSNEGDFAAGTNDGILYTLRFGEVFTGSKASLETGDAADAEVDDDPTETEAASENDTADEESESDGDENALRGRYVFITAEFDETLLAPVGEPPVKPEPPEKKDPADAATDDTAETDAESKAEADPAKDPEYQQAVERYEVELAEYNRKKADFEKKVEAGQQQVEELSERFADWYYVIAAETFDDLAVDRSDLVEPKADDPESNPTAPALPPTEDDQVEPVMEALKKAEEEAKEAEESPAEAGSDDAKMKADGSGDKPKPPEESSTEKTSPETKSPEKEQAETKPGTEAEKPSSPPSVPLPEVTPGPPKADPAPAEAE